jgi:hypothetical protein
VNGPLGPYAALDHCFTVSVDSVPLRRYLEQVLGPLALPSGRDPAAAHYELTVAEAPFRLRRDGRVLHSGHHRSRPTAWLFFDVNQQALRATDGTIVHAAVASPDGIGAWLFPAASEQGKSTLVAGLVRTGWTYLSDEYAALTPAGLVRPYPRAIALDASAWPVFDPPPPAPPAAVERFWPAQRHVAAPRRAGRPYPVVAVVAHAYRAGGSTALRASSGLDALRTLLSCSFTLDRRAQADFALLARLAEHAASWRLDVGDLVKACKLLSSNALP